MKIKNKIIVLTFILIITTLNVYAIRNTVFSDIDADGDLDVFLEHLILNQGNGNFLRLNRTDGIFNVPNITQGYFFDADNQSFEAYLFIQRAGFTDLLYLNNRNSTFTNVTASSWLGRNLTGVAGDAIGTLFADLDGDNVTDILVNGVLITSNASGVFGLRNTSDVINRSGLVEMSRMNQLVAIDVNTDNRTDIIGVSETGNVSVYLSLGDTNNDGIPEFYEASYDLQLDILSQANFVAAGNLFYGLATNTAIPFYPFTGIGPPLVEDVFTDLYFANNQSANNLLIQRYPQLPVTYNITSPIAGAPDRTPFYLPLFEDFSTGSSVNVNSNGTGAIIADFDSDGNNSLDIFYSSTDNNTRIMLRNGSSWQMNFSSAFNLGVTNVFMIQAANLSNSSLLDLAFIGSDRLFMMDGTGACWFDIFNCTLPYCSGTSQPAGDYLAAQYESFTTSPDTTEAVNELGGGVTEGYVFTLAGDAGEQGLQSKGDLNCDATLLTGTEAQINNQPPPTIVGVPQGGGSGGAATVCINTGSTCCLTSTEDYCKLFCQKTREQTITLLELGHKPDDETLSVFNPPLDLTTFGYPTEKPSEELGIEDIVTGTDSCTQRNSYSMQGACVCKPIEFEPKEEFPFQIPKQCIISDVKITPLPAEIIEEKEPNVLQNLAALLTGTPFDATDKLTEFLVDQEIEFPASISFLGPPDLVEPPGIFGDLPGIVFTGMPPLDINKFTDQLLTLGEEGYKIPMREFEKLDLFEDEKDKKQKEADKELDFPIEEFEEFLFEVPKTAEEAFVGEEIKFPISILFLLPAKLIEPPQIFGELPLATFTGLPPLDIDEFTEDLLTSIKGIEFPEEEFEEDDIFEDKELELTEVPLGGTQST